jgi:choline dehydrogenase-like flavoprotein
MKRYDVIVVGSGAAGSFAARELGEQGLSVLVLEAGRAVGPQDMLGANGRKPKGIDLTGRIRAFLAGQPIQARVAFFSERMVKLLVRDRLHPYRKAKDAPYLWFRGRQVGGRLHIFGRVLHRWADSEFAPHEGSADQGWPIRYADLEPYYAKAETILSIQGNNDGVATMPDGVMDGPGLLTRTERTFKAIIERRWPKRRVTSWRFGLPDTTPMPKALDDALASGKVTLQPDAVVTQVLTDEATGLATGVRYRDRESGEEHEVFARAVVLGASPVETVRLLLASRSARHPEGIGNRNGLVGRYFMDQPATLVFARFPGEGDPAVEEDLPSDPRYGTSGGIFIPRQADGESATDRKPALGYSYQGSIGRNPHVRPSTSRDATFMCFSEMQPSYDNRVSLDPVRTDRWGMPVPVIRCRLGAVEKAELPAQADSMAEMVEAAGGDVNGWISPLGMQERGAGIYADLGPVSRLIVRKMLPHSLTMGAAIHESGGARMGDNPETSVVDRFNRVWSAPNVIVTDASAFVSSGVMGTTLTVMAMATRACAHLAEQLRAAQS